MPRIGPLGSMMGFCIALLPWGLFPCPIGAQEDPATRLRGLNDELLQLHSEVLSYSTDQSTAQRSGAAHLIQQRAAALGDLIQHDPAQALSLALSPEVLEDLAVAFPESASSLELHGKWHGSIERWVADGADLRSSKTLTRLNTGNLSLDLHFAGLEPAGLTSGSILEATGVQVGTRVAVIYSSITSSNTLKTSTAKKAGNPASAEMSITSTEPLCSTTGNQNTAVLLATFPGVTPPVSVTTTSVYDIFFGASGRSLDGFWREASYGQTSASGNVFGWYILDQAYTCSSMNLLGNAAIAAANADVNFQNYTRIFIVLPYNPGCGWSGQSMVGCSSLSSPSGSFTASISYLVPSDMATSDNGVTLVAHEGGHQLGLLHAQSRDFVTEALGPLGATGTIAEYGDPFSTMGAWELGLYSAPHKAEVLGWMNPTSNYQVVQSSGVWSLQPLEVSSPGLQALKVQRGTGNNAWLWVEYRQPIGNYDSTLPTQPGALIHYEDSITDQYGPHTNLLDFAPVGTPNSFTAPALLPGQTWIDPYTNLSLFVQSATANALTVAVNYGAMPCTHANPAITASPLNPSTSPGENVGYNISITNNDSTSCPADTFSLSSSQPSGWTTTFSSNSLTLNPGQTAAVSMTKNVPGDVLAGIYPVDANAEDGTNAASGLASVTVTTPPTITASISIPSSTYAVRQTVSVTATVWYGAATAAGASVKFTMTLPGGGTITKNLTTNSNGNAVWSYKIGPRGPLGAYSVAASATYSSQTGTSDTATFMVQ
jgi:M6 family metalloprotease-like protein